MKTSENVLRVYERLLKGEKLNKRRLMEELEVTEKVAQRYLDDIRHHIDGQHDGRRMKYDRRENTYGIVNENRFFTGEDLLALSKILIHTRAFPKKKFEEVMEKLGTMVPETYKGLFSSMIQDEVHHYTELRHGRDVTEVLWKVSSAVYEKRKMTINYRRQDKKVRQHTVWPVSVMFSEFYFYMIAYIEGKAKEYPAVFRLDRLDHCLTLDERFKIPYRDRFNDGEFRKKIQFMYAGPLMQVNFRFQGDSLEAILDRFPVVKRLEQTGINEAEVVVEGFGKGIEMWLNAQGDSVEVLEVKKI